MKTLFRASVAYAFCACVAGCAGPAVSPGTTLSAREANDAIAVGKSTKADVIAALGNATVVRFDSGFEVWVYHVADGATAKASQAERMRLAGSGRGTAGKAEFVLLFDPSGVVTKTRIRPPPPPSQGKGS